MLPAPSHCCALQSPGVGSVSRVPADRKVKPHTPCALHTRVWQALSTPEQVLAVRQPTHCPVALHRLPPPHEALSGSIVCDGAPSMQKSLVQGFRSSGRSLPSLTDIGIAFGPH